MRHSSFAQTNPTPVKPGKERRSRVYFHESAHESINRRLEEVQMTFSDYMRYLVRMDIGVYV